MSNAHGQIRVSSMMGQEVKVHMADVGSELEMNE